MKLVAIVLIILGIGMLVFHGLSYTKEKNVIDAGPIQVNTKEHKTISWPVYSGGIAIIAGFCILLVAKNKSV